MLVQSRAICFQTSRPRSKHRTRALALRDQLVKEAHQSIHNADGRSIIIAWAQAQEHANLGQRLSLFVVSTSRESGLRPPRGVIR